MKRDIKIIIKDGSYSINVNGKSIHETTSMTKSLLWLRNAKLALEGYEIVRL